MNVLMDGRTARVTDPVSSPSRIDRRRRARQRLHTPVYVTFNGPQSGMVLDLSELIDLNEDGFAVQTGSGLYSSDAGSKELEVNHPVTLCLDLPETKSYVHGSGLVVWRDGSGRAGIRFSFLPDRALPVLKEWLFVNLLIACSNHAARAEQRTSQESGPASAAPVSIRAASAAAPSALVPADPTPPATLEDLRQQIREFEARDIETRQDSTEAILDLIADRAARLTGATGSALALITGARTVCRARSGDPAPPLGAEVNISEGLSGECVRTGKPVLCDDTATDTRVDSELCRALGLGSFLAVPVLSDNQVVGLIEVLSPNPGAFSGATTEILVRLAELIPAAKARTSEPDSQGGGPDTGEKGRNGSMPQPVEAKLSDQGTVDSGAAGGIGQEQPEPDRTSSSQITPSQTTPDPAPPDRTATKQAVTTLIPELAHSSDAEPVLDLSLPAESSRQTLPGPAASSLDNGTPATTVNPEPGLPAPSLFSHVVAKDAISFQSVRDALWEKSPGHRANPVAESAEPTAGSEIQPTRRARAAHFGMLLAALGALALALGYLLAPRIERRLAGSTPASQPPITTVSASSNPERAKALTPEELRGLADRGDAEAQWQLGTLYHTGDGLPQNDRQAVEWFQRSANQGYAQALRALGSAYWGGRGVKQDNTEAYAWFALALAQGDQESKSLLEGLATQMTQSQVATARQQAEAWLHAHNAQAKSTSN